MTSYNPLPAHLQAAQDHFTSEGGVPTPTYMGMVDTGAQWDYIIGKDGRKSRTPSRSPHRAATEPPVLRPSSLSHSQTMGENSTQYQQQPIPVSIPGSSFPPPSAYPQEPTITEEAAAVVSRSMTARQQPQAINGNGANGHGYPVASGSSKPSKSRTRMVGDWQLGKTLGAGSMGKVKLAINVLTKEKCAVKIIPRYTEATRREEPKTAEEAEKQRQRDESKEIRTIREAHISLLLHHPFICGMREFISHQNHHYMVFEFIDGGQMLDYIISHGRLRERAARKFARQIGSALDYCHRNSIVHRDLKIENILISKNGNIKIIDFGLSNLYAPGRHLSTFCGSLYFAAPELLNAKAYTGPEVDVWSFGIVLYVLVCGKVPFDDQSMPALHAKIKRGLCEYPAWLSADCKNLLTRMLNINPAERATLSEVLAHPFLTKGYEGPMESYLIHREPLRADDIDWDIVTAMEGFTFGTPETIYDDLRAVLTSEAYISCVNAWESRKDRRRGPGMSGSTMSVSDVSDSPKKKRFSGFDFAKKKLFKEEKKVEEPVYKEKEPQDPTRGFDPLISIYFLAREKMERERVYGKGHFASSNMSIEGRDSAGYGRSIAQLQAPPSSHAMGGYDSPQDSGFISQPRQRAEEVPNPVMQHPTADREQSQIADIPTAHARQPSLSQPPLPSQSLQPSPIDKGEEGLTKKFSLLGRGPRPASAVPSRSSSTAMPPSQTMTPSPSMPLHADHRRATTIADKAAKHERRVSVGSISNLSSSVGRATGLSRRSSQRAAKPQAVEPAWMNSPKEADEYHPSQASVRPEQTTPERDLAEEVELHANGDVKSVYLKGLFSVSTTSTKPAAQLIRDVSAVLDRLGIKHRPIKGGFECVHLPSIDLNSVVNGDEASTSLSSVAHPSASASGIGRRKPSLRRKSSKAAINGSTAGSRGPSPAPARAAQAGSSGTFSVGETASAPGAPPTPGRGRGMAGAGEEDELDAWALAQAGGAGSSLIVRFEIFVVKVSWMPLHGIQFRRVGGDGWQYQQLAKTILREMRL
ncbi:CAMK/CAMKL/KIN1 protein kinase [Kwoniella heveanensis CBS 569]|nr:CAMK/CAMKL/KIN1 protein kinase [Kwoniella heveanensis CBS 569]